MSSIGEASDEVSPSHLKFDADRQRRGNQTALHNDLQALDQFSVRIRFKRNETIFNEGDYAGHAYKVISGMVRLCKHTQDGRRQIADFLLEGNFRDHGSRRIRHGRSGDDIVLMLSADQIDRLSARSPA